MKPIPEEILKLYPLRCIVPGRPWWGGSSLLLLRQPIVGRVRCIDASGHAGWFSTPDGQVSFDTTLSDPMTVAETAARIDAEHPILHPGFRSMQLWACVTDAGIVETLTISGAQTDQSKRQQAFTVDGCYGSARVYNYVVPETWLHDVLDGDAFLLFDAVCPWMAPWSPA